MGRKINPKICSSCGFTFSTTDFGKQHEHLCKTCFSELEKAQVPTDDPNLFSDRRLITQTVGVLNDAEFDRRMQSFHNLFAKLREFQRETRLARVQDMQDEVKFRRQQAAEELKERNEAEMEQAVERMRLQRKTYQALRDDRRNSRKALYKEQQVGNLSVGLPAQSPFHSVTASSSPAQQLAVQVERSYEQTDQYDAMVNGSDALERRFRANLAARNADLSRPPPVMFGQAEYADELFGDEALGWLQGMPGYGELARELREYTRFRRAKQAIPIADWQHVNVPEIPDTFKPILRSIAERTVATERAWRAAKPFDTDQHAEWEEQHKQRKTWRDAGLIEIPFVAEILVSEMPLTAWERPARPDEQIVSYAHSKYREMLEFDSNRVKDTNVEEEFERSVELEKKLTEQAKQTEKRELPVFNLRQ